MKSKNQKYGKKNGVRGNMFVSLVMSFLMVCSVTALMPVASADNGSAVTTRINSGAMPVATTPVKQRAGNKAVTQFTSNTIATSPKVSRASQHSDSNTREITATVQRLPNNNVVVTGRITGNVPTRRPYFYVKIFSRNKTTGAEKQLTMPTVRPNGSFGTSFTGRQFPNNNFELTIRLYNGRDELITVNYFQIPAL